MQSNFIIYGLADPETHHLRYVGKSTSGLHRPQAHSQPWAIKKYAGTHKGSWIKGLVDRGLVPDIVIIETLDCPETLYDHERFWIKYFREMGCRLTNLTDGGEGTQGHHHTAESKKLQSLAKKGKPLTPARAAAVQKMIASNVGRKWGPRPAEWSAKLGYWKGKVGPNKGKERTEAWRLNNSKSNGGRAFKDQNGVEYQTIHSAARALNIPATKICSVLKGRRKSAGGYTFSYVS